MLLLLSSCATPSKVSHEKPTPFQQRREEFLGYWVGEMPTQDGKFMKWLVERRADGSFTLTHIMKNSPQDPVKFDPEKAQFELGTWGVSGDVYFTATRQYFEKGKVANFDTTEAGLYDAYKIVFFDGSSFTYQSLESGKKVTVKKIPKGSPVEL